jgi:hypothetical protein
MQFGLAHSRAALWMRWLSVTLQPILSMVLRQQVHSGTVDWVAEGLWVRLMGLRWTKSSL